MGRTGERGRAPVVWDQRGGRATCPAARSGSWQARRRVVRRYREGLTVEDHGLRAGDEPGGRAGGTKREASRRSWVLQGPVSFGPEQRHRFVVVGAVAFNAQERAHLRVGIVRARDKPHRGGLRRAHQARGSPAARPLERAARSSFPGPPASAADRALSSRGRRSSGGQQTASAGAGAGGRGCSSSGASTCRARQRWMGDHSPAFTLETAWGLPGGVCLAGLRGASRAETECCTHAGASVIATVRGRLRRMESSSGQERIARRLP